MLLDKKDYANRTLLKKGKCLVYTKHCKPDEEELIIGAAMSDKGFNVSYRNSLLVNRSSQLEKNVMLVCGKVPENILEQAAKRNIKHEVINFKKEKPDEKPVA